MAQRFKFFTGMGFDPSNPEHRPPYIKGKGFCPNPIVIFGIPKYADSLYDKKVIGTPEYIAFWEEELRRIHNGYQTGGWWIPGRYYYYLNYSVMQDVKGGSINPDIDDLHMELAYLIEYCKTYGKNLMIPKARRKGISEATHKMVIDYGWRFTYDYKAGIASGKKDFIDDFVKKLRYGWMYLPPEFYTNPDLNNDDEIIAGYSEKNNLNSYVQAGTRNIIYTRTIHTDATGFKGNYYRDIIVEEIGETEKFLEFWRGTKSALTDGIGNQIGSAFCYGTGGKMDKGSKDFKKAWSRNEKENFIDTNNFIRFLIPAQRFNIYGGASEAKRRIPKDSKLLKEYQPYQLIGVEDIETSLANILKERADLITKSDKQDYYEHLQNEPINEQEIFAKTIVNNFDSQKLSAQQAILDGQVHPKWTKYKFIWAKDKNGMPTMTPEPKVLEKHDDQETCVWILDEGHPVNNYIGRYSAGIDGYNVDQTKNSKSLGGMCVIDRVTKTPVAVICCRPARKEMFYELCIQLSIYYKMYGNVLGDIGSDSVMKHFELFGCYQYLADRPKKFESLTSEQMHVKWVRLTDYSKPKMIGLMQSHVIDHCDKIWFPELISQISTYDEGARDSDNDLADAYGIALMQDISYDMTPKNTEDDQIPDRFALPKFSNGQMVRQADPIKNIQQDSNLFGMMFGKQPE
ncbi:MAG: hypothetical protein WC055_02075 [Melioribacteraceae bacterium]